MKSKIERVGIALRKTQDAKISELLKAASEENVDACYQLASLCYIAASSPTVILDGYASAIKFARLAVELRSSWAATLLGHIYSNKNYSGKNLKTAARYYARAVRMGHDYAREELQRTRVLLKKANRRKERRTKFDNPIQTNDD